MEEKHTITIQVTAEQGEKIFKLLSGSKSRQAKYQERKRSKTNETIITPKITMSDIMPLKQEQKTWYVYEVEPSLYPPGLRDPRTVLVSDKKKPDLIPAFQDLSGLSEDDPANHTLLANGNRFYPSEVDTFASEAEAIAFAKQYAKEEGIDITLPMKYPKYYEVAS